MTVIIGLQNNGSVWMGADSASVTNNHYLSTLATPKVFKIGPYLIGAAGTVRLGQILRCNFEPPVNVDVEPELFIMTAFIESLRECLVANRYVDDKGLISLNGRVMVGYEGQLYIVSGDFSVMKSTHPFAAIGDGASVALGALAALVISRDYDMKRRVMFVLEIVEKFMTNVRAPFVIESIGVDG